jgi:hypothetical protein
VLGKISDSKNLCIYNTLTVESVVADLEGFSISKFPIREHMWIDPPEVQVTIIRLDIVSVDA